MPTASAQATAMAARLRAALDVVPEIDEAADHIRVQAVLPEQLSPTQESDVLAVLADADGYGHSSTSDGRTVWALIHKSGT